jgi:two-component system, OmpR family, alkaline phosphatase synthesis response regulator PhoP
MSQSVKNLKVLLVEDDKDILDLYAIAFQREGFTVYTANDGKQAIDKFHDKGPDILLLDIMMPNVDGYAVLKEVRKDHKQYVPVIMLTNLNMEHFAKEESVDQVDAYLIKSNFTPSEVVSKAIEVLRLNKKIKS